MVTRLKHIDELIDSGQASNKEHAEHINLMQEFDAIEKIEAMDLAQKSHIKRDVEGDENTNFFHGFVKQKRRSQMIQ
ncbi:hypothetical protein Tco_0174506, partial [Tanacetum coccineum]